MALADYRLCDKCECKVFYDSNLNYEYGCEIPYEELIRGKHYKLENLGDWAVICRSCAKRYELRIVSKEVLPPWL